MLTLGMIGHLLARHIVYTKKGGRAEYREEMGSKHTAPDMIPEEPKPAMARPTMKEVELGAAPQMADPTSKRKTADRKTALILKKV